MHGPGEPPGYGPSPAHPATPRTISARAATYIKGTEYFEPRPYNDPARNATIGYGHFLHYGSFTQADVARWGAITKAEALQLFDADAAHAAAAVRSLVKVPLDQGQLDALTDFVFNFGENALAGSTLLHKLNAGHYNQVPAELRRWIHDADGNVLPGLVRRRAVDIAMFTRGVYPG